MKLHETHSNLDLHFIWNALPYHPFNRPISYSELQESIVKANLSSFDMLEDFIQSNPLNQKKWIERVYSPENIRKVLTYVESVQEGKIEEDKTFKELCFFYPDLKCGDYYFEKADYPKVMKMLYTPEEYTMIILAQLGIWDEATAVSQEPLLINNYFNLVSKGYLRTVKDKKGEEKVFLNYLAEDLWWDLFEKYMDAYMSLELELMEKNWEPKTDREGYKWHIPENEYYTGHLFSLIEFEVL